MIDRGNYFSLKNSGFLGWGNRIVPPCPKLGIFIGENDELEALWGEMRMINLYFDGWVKIIQGDALNVLAKSLHPVGI